MSGLVGNSRRHVLACRGSFLIEINNAELNTLVGMIIVSKRMRSYADKSYNREQTNILSDALLLIFLMSSKLTKQVNMVSSMCSVRVQPRRGSVYVDIGVVRTPDSRGIVRVAVIPCRIGQRIVPIPSIHADIVTFQVPTANERSETYLL